MPVVKRMIVREGKTARTKSEVEVELFLAPGEVKPSDVVTEPRDRMLAALAYSHPTHKIGGRGKTKRMTFKQLAAKRGLEVWTPPELEPDKESEDQLLAMAHLSRRMFPALKQGDAIALVDATDDSDVLRQLLEAELEADNPREPVIAAFEARGFKVEDEEEVLPEDEDPSGDGPEES